MILGLERSPGGGHDSLLYYSCPENHHRLKSLAGYSPWSCKEPDTIERLSTDAEKAMASHSSTLAWKIPWTEERGGCSPWGHYESGKTERLHFHFSLSCTGGGNGNPLQKSCLENPRDGAAVCGVAQSRTRLKRLSSSSSSIEYRSI